MSRNHLDQETSPYLLLHKDNPVHWRPWGPEALAEAEASNKPILLSIGYTACHWCHVMNEESFSDQATADIINENYIPIKVDREERPDVDNVYQASANFLGVQGGWPLTAFLTPNAQTFFAGTYFPLVSRLGMPEFKQVLTDIVRVYREQPDKVLETTSAISNQLSHLWNRNVRTGVSVAALDSAAIRIGQKYDAFYGGLIGEPKFPTFSLLQTLMRAYLRGGSPVFNQLAQITLRALCLGGIYDHLGGGLARYSTDETWIVPHFEKMLYDNAQFIEILTLAWQLDRNPLYKLRVEETIDWVLREMMVDRGFASSIDADSEGEEGKFYVWSETEVDAALAGTFSQRFKAVYNITAAGNFNGRSVPHRASSGSEYPQSDADEAVFKKQRGLLLAIRDKRPKPRLDDKVQADWNGMMIAALAEAAAAFKTTQWTAAAIKAFEFVQKTLADGDRLYHSWRNGQRQHAGFSEDYAHMARAALALWQTTGDPQYLERAKSWVRVLNEHFWDRENGGYFQTGDDSDKLIARVRTVFDTNIPCANGIMPTVLAQLYQGTSDDDYGARANAVAESFGGELTRAYMSMGSYLNSAEYLATNLQIIVVGPLISSKTHELVAAIRGRALPNKFLIVVSPDDVLPETHPAHGKTLVNGQPAAYICQGMTCSQPFTNPVSLSQALQLPPKAAVRPISRVAGTA
jgi:uncharacterized protein YyaL (SSP411 family)